MLLFALAGIGAYFIRFDLMMPTKEWVQFAKVLPMLLAIKILVFFMMGVYRGMWRYVSINDLLTDLKATVVSSQVLMVVILAAYRFEGFSRGVFVLDGLLTFGLVVGARVIIRQMFSMQRFGNGREAPVLQRFKKPLLIIGAGDAGEKTLREIRDNPQMRICWAGHL